MFNIKIIKTNASGIEVDASWVIRDQNRVRTGKPTSVAPKFVCVSESHAAKVQSLFSEVVEKDFVSQTWAKTGGKTQVVIVSDTIK